MKDYLSPLQLFKTTFVKFSCSVRKRVDDVTVSNAMMTPRGGAVTSTDDPAVRKAFCDYTGPTAYQKPTGKSNRKIIQNAISHCCLSGGVNKDAQQKCLQVYRHF